MSEMYVLNLFDAKTLLQCFVAMGAVAVFAVVNSLWRLK
jgi:hypothetical protein